MSKQSRRVSRRNRNRDWFGADGMAYLVGWCRSEQDRPEARTGTHDALIKLTGEHRRSGVGWLELSGDEARQFLRSVRQEAHTGELLDHYETLGRILRRDGGFLVVAMCEAVVAADG